MDASSLARMRAQYDEDGYVRAPRLFMQAEIDAIKRQIDELSAKENIRGDEAIEVHDGVVFQIYDVPRREPPLGMLPERPALKTLVADLLAAEAAVGWALLLNKVNDSQSNWEIPWHQDTSVYCREIPSAVAGEWRGGFYTFRPTDDSMSRLTVARIVLDGDTLSSGCLWVIPGSHKLGNKWPDGGRMFEGQAGQPIELEPGDVLFFNPLLMHRADFNRTGAQRRIVHIYYRPAMMTLPNGAEWIDWTIRT